jgi:hypothetical protein
MIANAQNQAALPRFGCTLTIDSTVAALCWGARWAYRRAATASVGGTQAGLAPLRILGTPGLYGPNREEMAAMQSRRFLNLAIGITL